MKKISKVLDIQNVEDLKSYLTTSKNIDYADLVKRSAPTNGDYFQTSRATPMFEHLLDNIPDLWMKVRDWGKEVYLAKVTVGVVNHYAKDAYWDKFVNKLGEHINLYKKSEHKEMWTHALLNFSPAIFREDKLNDVVEKSIGQKELNDIYLNHINDFSISHRYEVERALRDTPKEDFMKVLKRHINNEKFYDVFYMLTKSQRTDITKEEVMNITINSSPLETYLRDKREEYTVEITGESIKRGSHEKIDKIFCKNLMDANHYYRLNYFNLVKTMENLNIPDMEEMLPAETKRKKVKMN